MGAGGEVDLGNGRVGVGIDARHHALAIGDRPDAADAGGYVLAPARERPWGQYSGYFRDPDGYLWEVMHFLPNDAETP